MAKLLAQKIVVDVFELLATIVIPRIAVFVQHGRRLGVHHTVSAAWTLERIVGITLRVFIELEQDLKVLERELTLLVLCLVHNTFRKRLLAQLSLQDLFFNGTGGDEPIDKASLRLSLTPNTGQSLLIGRRIPIGVEKHQPIGTYEVDAASARLAAEQEDEAVHLFGIIELVDILLTLLRGHCAVQSEGAPIVLSTHTLEHV